MLFFFLIISTFQQNFNITTPYGNPSQYVTLQSYQTLILKADFNDYELTKETIIIQITENDTQQVNNSCQMKIMNRQSDNLTIYINVTNVFNDSIFELITFSAQILTPQRGKLGKPYFFPFVLSSKLITEYTMPFNLPTNLIYNFEVINQNLEAATQTLAPFGQEYWQDYYSSNEITLLVMPWIPFMGNCQDLGDFIYLYNVIENATLCQLISQEDTLVVNMVPTTGFNPRGDICRTQLTCYYWENLQVKYEGNKWWQADKETLFYISKYALNDQFVAQNQDDSYTNYFSNLISSQDESLVPVIFKTGGVLNNQYPIKFKLEILYNQVSDTEKQIVTAIVTSSEYSEIQSTINSYTLEVVLQPMNYLQLINSFQFDVSLYIILYIIIGILANIGVMLLWFANKSIFFISNSSNLRIFQTLIIAFIPTITGCLRATFIIIIYVLFLDNVLAYNLFSNISFNYDGLQDESDTVDSYSKGRVGLMLTVSGIIFIKIACKIANPMPSNEEWQVIQQNYEKQKEVEVDEFNENENESKQESITKQDEIKEVKISSKNDNNAHSNSISRQGSLNSKQLPAVPDSAPPILRNKNAPKKSIFKRATIIKKRSSSIEENHPLKDENSPNQILPRQNSMNNQLDKKSSIQGIQHSSSQHQSEKHISNSHEEQEDENIIEQIQDSLISKHYYYQFVCIMVACFLLFLVGLSYEVWFYSNLYQFLVVLQLIEVIFYWIISTYALEEQTLIQPIMTSLEVIQFVMFMAAETFQEFIFAYLIRLALIIVFRIYIDPIIKNLKPFLKRAKIYLNQQYQMFQEITQSDKKKNDTISYYLGEELEPEFQEDKSIEPVIEMGMNFSTKGLAIFLKPIALIFIKIFEKESQIPNNYQIGFRALDYYIYFAFFIMIPQIFIDIFVLNCLERIYGFKIYDYFDYCKFRNDYRIQKFFEHSLNYDKSLSPSFRSIDNMKFTDQFYYNNSLIVFGILLCIIGTTIIMQNNYSLYADPAVFLTILILYAFINIIQQIILYLWNKIDIWKIKEIKQKMALDSLTEFLNPSKKNLDQIVEADAFKKMFIQQNKEWLINNLELFITSNSFNQQDQFLLQTYQFLLNEGRKEQKEKLRNELLIKKQKELELKQKKRKQKTSHSQSFIKSQVEFEDGQNQQKTIRIKRSQVENLRKMLSIWYYKAKQTIFLKSLAQDVLIQNQAEHCKRCGQDSDLRVVELIPIERLSNQFKYRIMGTPFNKFEWIKYYETYQKFITLCLDCEMAYKSRLLQRQNQSGNDVAKMTQQNYVAKAFVYKWLFLARSRLLYVKEPYQQKFYEQPKDEDN